MDISQALQPLFNSKSLPHAVLFEGDGRHEASKLYAKACVCAEDKIPCSKCRDCKKADNGVHPDIIEYYPSGALLGYPIDTIREIRSDAYISPNEAIRKVYILNDVDNISEVSQNALLKILEEPPKTVVFVLNCSQKSHLLDTIISRVTVFNGGMLSSDGQSDEAAETAEDIINAAICESQIVLLKKLNDLAGDKTLRIAVFAQMKNYLRRLYRAKCLVDDDEQLQQLVEKLTLNNILNALDAVEKADKANFRRSNIRLYITRLSAELKMLLG